MFGQLDKVRIEIPWVQRCMPIFGGWGRNCTCTQQPSAVSRDAAARSGSSVAVPIWPPQIGMLVRMLVPDPVLGGSYGGLRSLRHALELEADEHSKRADEELRRQAREPTDLSDEAGQRPNGVMG